MGLVNFPVATYHVDVVDGCGCRVHHAQHRAEDIPDGDENKE